MDLNNFLHVACNYHYLGWVIIWKYLKQWFWEKIYIYIRGLNSVQSGVLPVYYSDHAAIYSIFQYSMLYIKAAFYKYIKLNIMQVWGNTSRINALGGSFISFRKKEKIGLYFFSVGDAIYWFWYFYSGLGCVHWYILLWSLRFRAPYIPVATFLMN